MEKTSSTSNQFDVLSPELGPLLSQTVSSIVLSVLDIVKAFDNPQTRDALGDLAKGYAPRSNGERGRETRFVPTPGYEMRIAPIALAMEATKPTSTRLKPVFRQYDAAIKESLGLEAKDGEIAFFFESCGFKTASVINVGIYLREIRREIEEAARAPVARPPPVSASPSAPPTAPAKTVPPSDTAPTPPLAPEPSKTTSVDDGLTFNPQKPRPGSGEPAPALNAAKTSAALPNVEQPVHRAAPGVSADAQASYPAEHPFNVATNTPSEGQVGARPDINQSASVARPPNREATSSQKRVKGPPVYIDDDDGFTDTSNSLYATSPHPLFDSAPRETHLHTAQPLYPTTNSNGDLVESETDDGFGAYLQPRRIGLARPPFTSSGTSSTVSPSGGAAAHLGAGSDPRRSSHPKAGSSASPSSHHVDHVQEGAGFRRSAVQPPPNLVPDDSEAPTDEDGPLPPRKLSQGEPQ